MSVETRSFLLGTKSTTITEPRMKQICKLIHARDGLSVFENQLYHPDTRLCGQISMADLCLDKILLLSVQGGGGGGGGGDDYISLDCEYIFVLGLFQNCVNLHATCNWLRMNAIYTLNEQNPCPVICTFHFSV